MPDEMSVADPVVSPPDWRTCEHRQIEERLTEESAFSRGPKHCARCGVRFVEIEQPRLAELQALYGSVVAAAHDDNDQALTFLTVSGIVAPPQTDG